MSRWIGGGAGSAEISAVDQVSGSGLGLTTISVSANFGAENTNRAVVIAVCDPGANDPLTRTIGGVSATQITTTLFSGLKLWYAIVPTGTSGNIVQTYTAPQSEGISIMVFRLVKYKSITPVGDTGTLSASGTNDISGSLLIKSKGVSLCFVGDPNATGRTTTWSAPVSEVYDYSPNLSSAKSASAAIFNNSGADTAPTITATPSTSSANRYGRYVSWR